MAQKTFRRYELKFIVNKEAFQRITAELPKYMNLDKHCSDMGTYMIHNIYFDTPDDEIIQKSLAKPYYKEKLRLRSYTNPIRMEDKVFLELKKKIGGIVNKRRATMTYQEAISFIRKREYPKNCSYLDEQVLKEIEVFLNRYSVEAKAYLSYKRIAYYGKEDREFRVTFDENILTRREKVNFTSGDYGMELLNNKYLMEVKIIGAIPLWLAKLLSELKVYRGGFSKYGEEYKRYLKQKDNILQVV
ncbi:polyphosphate polymerase domain-containing protein [Clostridium septicum]|uniref:polyphosphate polymerase domain-containing protein n=1 Tax=Clostridium septicum TaxID=1504 RepID=UPI0032166607